jgi:arylsulfatase A-like enzyme
MFGHQSRQLDALIDAPDVMPTLLGLCGLPMPETVEGLDFSRYMQGGEDPSDGAVLIMCPHPFGEWARPRNGGREYRGLRTHRYTYVRTLEGPWLFYDNHECPYQAKNLVNEPAYNQLRRDLDDWLQRKLDALGDEFLPGMDYIRKWNYTVNETGTVPYKN